MCLWLHRVPAQLTIVCYPIQEMLYYNLYGHEVLSEQSLVCTMYDYIATINTQGVLMQLQS